MGPTAVGKTGVSLAVAGDEFEIISADSVQVYRYLDIGSGKPDRADRERVPHHVIDCVEPDVPFTAGDFCREARKAVDTIVSRGMKPLIVGGTGLYIDSYFQGLSEIPEIPPDVREAVRREAEERGLQALHDELVRVDPAFGTRIHPNDRQRITRGLEVYRGTGMPLSSYYGSKCRYGSDDTLFIGLTADRAELQKRIDDRVDSMMERGLVEEVRSLRERGFGPGLKSMKSIGYAEINGYIDGAMGLGEAVGSIKTATRQYAKRQMTWFGRNGRIRWFGPGEISKVEELLRRWLRGEEI
ncbi:MAG: tRNA (adenosine(37)-N6)-dimethylallyltransferase MiaA [Spirochaetes bacterium]|nr:tRNA (adenosine(37)-N6)-dimethylallyltransferase MiaA [Spirochaetota bacterium]